MLALIGPRGNGRTRKLAQWALASGGTIIVPHNHRVDYLVDRCHVPREQIVTVDTVLAGEAMGRTHATLVAIDDVDHVLQAALQITSPIDLITFYGGAMQP
jgi:hypothetical protein